MEPTRQQIVDDIIHDAHFRSGSRRFAMLIPGHRVDPDDRPTLIALAAERAARELPADMLTPCPDCSDGRRTVRHMLDAVCPHQRARS